MISPDPLECDMRHSPDLFDRTHFGADAEAEANCVLDPFLCTYATVVGVVVSLKPSHLTSTIFQILIPFYLKSFLLLGNF